MEETVNKSEGEVSGKMVNISDNIVIELKDMQQKAQKQINDMNVVIKKIEKTERERKTNEETMDTRYKKKEFKLKEQELNNEKMKQKLEKKEKIKKELAKNLEQANNKITEQRLHITRLECELYELTKKLKEEIRPIKSEHNGIYVDEKKVKYKSLLEPEMINKWREIPKIQFKVMLILHLFYPAIIYTDYTKIKINGTTNPEENYYFNGRVFINRCQTKINKKKMVIVLDQEHHQLIEEFISTDPKQEVLCQYHYDSYRRKLKQITKRYLGEEIGLKEFNKFFLIEE